MTGISNGFFGVSFSLLVTMLASLILFLGVWFGAKEHKHLTHVDAMAGDEGED